MIGDFNSASAKANREDDLDGIWDVSHTANPAASSAFGADQTSNLGYPSASGETDYNASNSFSLSSDDSYGGSGYAYDSGYGSAYGEGSGYGEGSAYDSGSGYGSNQNAPAEEVPFNYDYHQNNYDYSKDDGGYASDYGTDTYGSDSYSSGSYGEAGEGSDSVGFNYNDLFGAPSAQSTASETQNYYTSPSNAAADAATTAASAGAFASSDSEEEPPKKLSTTSGSARRRRKKAAAQAAAAAAAAEAEAQSSAASKKGKKQSGKVSSTYDFLWESDKRRTPAKGTAGTTTVVESDTDYLLLPHPDIFNSYPPEVQRKIMEWADRDVRARRDDESQRQDALVRAKAARERLAVSVPVSIIVLCILCAAITGIVTKSAVFVIAFLSIALAIILSMYFTRKNDLFAYAEYEEDEEEEEE